MFLFSSFQLSAQLAYSATHITQSSTLFVHFSIKISPISGFSFLFLCWIVLILLSHTFLLGHSSTKLQSRKCTSLSRSSTSQVSVSLFSFSKGFLLARTVSSAVYKSLQSHRNISQLSGSLMMVSVKWFPPFFLPFHSPPSSSFPASSLSQIIHFAKLESHPYTSQ